VRQTAHLIADVLDKPNDDATITVVKEKVAALTKAFPVYGG
jgi:glycine hydroxymethyltransferase